MKKVLVLTVALIALALPQLFAQGGPPGMPPHPDRPMAAPEPPGSFGRGHGCGVMGGCNILDCAKELGLTDEQKDKIKEINFSHRNAMIDIEASMEKAQLKMRHEMRSDQPDKNKALAISKEVNAIHGQLAEARIYHRFALRGILTADQLKKWDDCKDECRGNGNGCRGGGRGMKNNQDCGHGMKHRDGSCRIGK